MARLRKERELKQEPLAEVAGFTQSYLSQIENGRVNLTLLRLNDLAECFQVSPIEFFKDPN
uniref:helix-turn-helix domain-containing protein n=1 Tax=Sphingomonas populi TaxID=2484750 RepID=UPI001E399C83|nr:helix-turn-helix transcriptional regulator [Sphingomonas populi]